MFPSPLPASPLHESSMKPPTFPIDNIPGSIVRCEATGQIFYFLDLLMDVFQNGGGRVVQFSHPCFVVCEGDRNWEVSYEVTYKGTLIDRSPFLNGV
jgi:hypothetical protein